ncbi:MAG TPA: hypothetical protein VKD90_07805 [Gemmataceae bacterium]|nr:hypothetical protein [Gemmataceae bacterium]
MNTPLDDPVVREADAQAVIDHFLNGVPLAPEVASRVRRRSEQGTEEVRRKFGTVEVAVDLVREGRDES